MVLLEISMNEILRDLYKENFLVSIYVLPISFLLLVLLGSLAFYYILDGIPVTERVKIATHQMIICKF